MKQVGRKIYFDTTTGNVITDTGERQGSVIETTIEHDIASYIALSERNRDTFDVLELAYGEHSQNFAECTGYKVNVETKKLVFSYPDPNNPESPQVFVKPLTEQIEELKIQNVSLMLATTDMFEQSLITEQRNADTMLALTELYEMVLGG